MKKTLIFILFSLSIISCNRNNSSKDILTHSVQLYHQKVFLKDELIFRNGEMLFFDKDSSLIIENFKSDSLLIKISLKDKKISHFIPVGNGPNEFVDINLSQKISDSTLLFMDINSSQLFQLNILTGYLQEDLSYNNSRCLRMAKVNNYYISTGIFEEGMFAIWDDTDFISYQVDYPKDKVDNKNNASKGLAYQGKLLANAKLNRFLFCSTLFTYFELFEFDTMTKNINSIKKNYIGEYEYVPSQDKNLVFAHPYENTREGYIDAFSTDDKIFLLYSGRSIEDAGIDNREKARLSNQIHIYDWNGMLLFKYETDIDLKNICVNKSANKIYGIAYIPDPEIVFLEI